MLVHVPDEPDRPYLLDRVSNMVYVFDKVERWPLLVGVLDEDSERVIRVESTVAHDFFKALNKRLTVGRAAPSPPPGPCGVAQRTSEAGRERRPHSSGLRSRFEARDL